ncbi:hypothetical protein H4684_000386 [Desulfomicrobium macestii]|uniref:Uncharacterized protein n=1 Tax=Desulfomicrobium macestii TaxID=90731 RepID=A0ABR9GZ72_9BACT|nr:MULTISPECIES: hypothetical protein [Desulfomicrobium]MBE1423765.1 hypothetical protein [Desulfomicrobium macestii]
MVANLALRQLSAPSSAEAASTGISASLIRRGFAEKSARCREQEQKRPVTVTGRDYLVFKKQGFSSTSE